MCNSHSPDNVEDIIDPRVIDPGHPSEIVCDILTPMALFSSFMTDVMLEDIVKCTNFKITQLRNQIGENNHNKSTYSNIDLIEIRCLIGLLIMAGSKKDNHVQTLDMFST